MKTAQIQNLSERHKTDGAGMYGNTSGLDSVALELKLDMVPSSPNEQPAPAWERRAVFRLSRSPLLRLSRQWL